jgi:hypothetical protein
MSTTAFDDQFAPDPNAPASIEPPRTPESKEPKVSLSEQWRAFTKDAPSSIQGGTKGRVLSEDQLKRIAEFLEDIDRGNR